MNRNLYVQSLCKRCGTERLGDIEPPGALSENPTLEQLSSDYYKCKCHGDFSNARSDG